MIDSLGRRISYLRLSVTDRCDLRCVYCMAEQMTFLPREDVLRLDELERLCELFLRLGVRKIRITGGEPLVRGEALALIDRLGERLRAGAFEELTLTTNGGRLDRTADALAHAGMRRINVSVDSLRPERFAAIARRDRFEDVMRGLDAADAAGLAVKINTVALRGINDDEFDDLIAWCGLRGYDLCLIETMPLGEVANDRTECYLPLSDVRDDLAKRWTLRDDGYATGGPARYVTVVETGRRLGFITPLTHGFCGDCNRLRLSCAGFLYPCLGHERAYDLKTPLRAGASDEALASVVAQALAEKPTGHAFEITEGRPAVARFMSATGG